MSQTSHNSGDEMKDSDLMKKSYILVTDTNDWINEQINVVISDEAESIYELELKEL